MGCVRNTHSWTCCDIACDTFGRAVTACDTVGHAVTVCDTVGHAVT